VALDFHMQLQMPQYFLVAVVAAAEQVEVLRR
jgi:hypothetical protein